jgi:hypothetical protein
MSHTDELARLAELHRNGDLTDEEFIAAKKKIIETTGGEKETTLSSVETSSPSPAAASPQVIVKAKEGCFLQTLNVGCMITAGFIGLVILVMIFSRGCGDDKIPSKTDSSTGATSTQSQFTTPAPAPSTVPETSASEPKLELQSFRWGESEFGGVAKLSGSVKNISNEKLDDVEVVGLFSDKNGELITSNDVLIAYNPILPGQISPFEVMVPWNPTMKTADVNFKELIGGTIAWRLKEKKKK